MTLGLYAATAAVATRHQATCDSTWKTSIRTGRHRTRGRSATYAANDARPSTTWSIISYRRMASIRGLAWTIPLPNNSSINHHPRPRCHEYVQCPTVVWKRVKTRSNHHCLLKSFSQCRGWKRKAIAIQLIGFRNPNEDFRYLQLQSSPFVHLRYLSIWNLFNPFRISFRSNIVAILGFIINNDY